MKSNSYQSLNNLISILLICDYNQLFLRLSYMRNNLTNHRLYSYPIRSFYNSIDWIVSSIYYHLTLLDVFLYFLMRKRFFCFFTNIFVNVWASFLIHCCIIEKITRGCGKVFSKFLGKLFFAFYWKSIIRNKLILQQTKISLSYCFSACWSWAMCWIHSQLWI